MVTKWSVGIETEGNRVMQLEEVVELADAVATSGGIATGIGTNRYGAQVVVSAKTRDEAIERATEEFSGGSAEGGPAGVPDSTGRGHQRGRRDGGRRMIRLGSLAGYIFDGPRVLGGWTPPSKPAVYGILYKPEPDTKPDKYAVISTSGTRTISPRKASRSNPRARCWIESANSKWKVHICTLEVEGGGRAHRVQITNELASVYHPHCNEQQYDNTWKDEWDRRVFLRTDHRPTATAQPRRTRTVRATVEPVERSRAPARHSPVRKGFGQSFDWPKPSVGERRVMVPCGTSGPRQNQCLDGE